jgi:hypothetical protein
VQYAVRLTGGGAGVNGYWNADRNLLTFVLDEPKITVEIEVGYYKTWLVCVTAPLSIVRLSVLFFGYFRSFR